MTMLLTHTETGCEAFHASRPDRCYFLPQVQVEVIGRSDGLQLYRLCEQCFEILMDQDRIYQESFEVNAEGESPWAPAFEVDDWVCCSVNDSATK